jgi:hypothetical protein
MALGLELRFLPGAFFLCPGSGGVRYDITGTHLSFESLMTALHSRKPQRLTITVSWVVFERLVKRSQMEGRSMSNLSSYILERHLCDDSGTDPSSMP